MFIQRDVNGARALRSLKTATKETSETLKKLSSGYCINVAADDAAGLAVSEKMRMQITGLDRAQQNSLEGSRLIQIGDGSLEEMHRMLNRAVELANMSSNGTYEDEVDREALQTELDKLYEEIDRIAESTNFNGIKLFQDKGYGYETGNAERRILAMKSMLEASGEYPPPGFGYMADPDYQPPASVASLQSEQRQVAVVSASSSDADSQALTVNSSTSAKNIAASMQADVMTLSDVLEGTKKGTVSIVYTDSPTQAIATAAANATNSSSRAVVSAANDPDITVDSSGATKKLSEVLEKDIVPRVVNNILNTYGGAFSYLSGKTIGIGLEYFNQGASSGGTTMAYVAGDTSSSNSYINFTLGVNIGALPTNAKRYGSTDDLSGLEATIAHEMIHAFMDQGATAGMFGIQTNQNGGVSSGRAKFPGWFIEGMAQTAGGANDRLINTMNLLTGTDAASPTGLTGATLTDLFNGADGANFKLGSNKPDSEYGTGYLACMYLGAVIGGYTAGSGSTALTTAVKNGLNQMLSSLINGASLDSTINILTQDFSSTSDFQNKFNSGTGLTSLDRDQFITDLCQAICVGGGGRGGLASDNGNLNAPDLVNDSGSLTIVDGLFKLDPTKTTVHNIQSPDNVLSGGALSTNGLSPDNKLPSYGELSFKSSGVINMKYQQNGTNHKFIFLRGEGNEPIISMKTAGAANLTEQHDITLQDNATVTLENAKLTGAGTTVTVEKNANIVLNGDNAIGDLKLNSNAAITFSGAGSVSLDKVAADNTNKITVNKTLVNIGAQSFSGANVVVQNGGAVLGSSSTGASSIQNGSGADILPLDFPKTQQLSGLSNITSIEVKNLGAAPVSGTPSFYFDPAEKSGYIVTFTDSAGKTKTLEAVNNSGTFTWEEMKPPFTVSGTEGTDWEYDFKTDTLTIKKNTPLTISGGTAVTAGGVKQVGKIKLADNIGTIALTLDGVNCDVSASEACAFDLGQKNTVNLTLTTGKENIFKSGKGYAGISLSAGTSLTIDAADDDTSKLEAVGGVRSGSSYGGGAGIGRSSADQNTGASGKIIIKGGNIKATGNGNSGGGAGIGAAYQRTVGDVEIYGGRINATGATDAAGIGGTNYTNMSNIIIGDKQNTKPGQKLIVIANAGQHGAGIGGGHNANTGMITIGGLAEIEAIGIYHGTGIGAGCLAKNGSDIIIQDNAVIKKAQGGDDGAGIGASWEGSCGDIRILGDAEILNASGGKNGAGIGAGSENSKCGNIEINTTKTVTATGGVNGVGIGSGCGVFSSRSYPSTVGDIIIKKGIVEAKGSTDSTGIGAGRGSTSGNITIGEAGKDNKVVVTAIGGMTYDGGNILADSDTNHTDDNNGVLQIFGTNTTLRTGKNGEGLYSTSGATDENGDKIYSYPVNLFEKPATLEAGKNLDNLSGKLPVGFKGGLPLPLGAKDIKITATGKDGTTKEWKIDLSHKPLDENYNFIWMTPQPQTLTIEYTLGGGQTEAVIPLMWYPKAGVWRAVPPQDPPRPAQKPGYSTDPPHEGTEDPDVPELPDIPNNAGEGGIVLQIGDHAGEFLEVPTFYLSVDALELDTVDIRTQDNAINSIGTIKNAINRVSNIRGTYGALYNRLEHNINNLGVMKENMTEAESAIRDADIANEMMKHTKHTILTQSAQAMLAQSNQNMSHVLQLIR